MSEEIITLHPNESLLIPQGEELKPGNAEALRIRFSPDGGPVLPPTPGYNIFGNAEQILWNSIWTAAGKQTAVYHYANINVTLKVVPNTPQPDGFGFQDFTLYKTSRIFVIGIAELNGRIPKEGDTLTYNNITHYVKPTIQGPAYEDRGNYNVMLNLHVSLLRGDN
ncbi:hypothetical protein FACS18942_04920 [Planctomycetales bacterium]|nr:hypothetical protein FACS18942_04920 [Planctomycetales bacterium]GHT33812.1 hypothetical protein FACS189427_00040 [Planctomycetales bacterium]